MAPEDAQRLAGVRAVVFDFDYTLADSTPAFLECHTLASIATGLRAPTVDGVRRSVGLGLQGAVRYLHPGIDPEAEAAYMGVYQKRADEIMTDQTTLFLGAAEAVRKLHAAGYGLAVVSQKLRYRVEEVLRREGLRNAFAAVIGGEDIAQLKPDPEGIEKALAATGRTAAEAVFVGDTVIDAEAAANARIAFVGVLTGETRRDELDLWRHVAILESVADLPTLLLDS